LVRAADPIDAAVPLHETHRIPRHVVIHDVPALLEVHALGQHVSRDEHIKAIL
jgi:hypothetical protein